jgi:hypothetical protein
MTADKEPDLIYGHFFFVDIVSSSDPKISTKTQIKKIKILQKCIKECNTYKIASPNQQMIINTGDGLSITFSQGPELPLKLAIELHKKLADYNKGKIPTEIIDVRIGLSNGIVYLIYDIFGRKNQWGPGIITARRVMDIGEAKHILLVQRMAEDLRELSDEYKKIIKPFGEYVLKHEQKMLVYSAIGDGFGNPNAPKQDSANLPKDVKSALYPSIKLEMTVLNPKTMLVRHKRTYEIVNISDKPISEISHGIATDVEKNTLDDLKVRIYDENNKDLEISKITMNYPYQKEFFTKFNTTILPNEKGHSYTIEYEVEEPERFFENAFLTDCHNFEILFGYPADSQIKQVDIYEINQEKEEKIKSQISPVKESTGKNLVVRWAKKDIAKGQTIRIEW